MYPSVHILTSLILALVLYPYFGLYSIVIFLAGFLIDIDHYFEYVARTGNLSPFKAYKEGIEFAKKCYKLRKSLRKDILHIFHVVEFYALIAILAIYSKFFLSIFIAITFHIILDIVALTYRNAIKARAHSLIGWLIRHTK